ncbi:hypothetical protein D3C72_1836070 [compost metagenome]
MGHEIRGPDALGRQMAAEIHADAGQRLLGETHGMNAGLNFLAIQQGGPRQFLHGVHGEAGIPQPLVGSFGVMGAEHQRFQPERGIGDFLARGRRARRPSQQLDVRAFQHDQTVARPQVVHRLVAQVETLPFVMGRQRIQPVAHHDDGVVEFSAANGMQHEG